MSHASLDDSHLEAMFFGDDDPEAEARAAESLAAAIATAQGLKPFPTTATQVLGLLDAREVNIPLVTDTLEKEPVLATGVLRLAASPLFRTRCDVVSLEQAVVRLGSENVRDMVASIAAMQMFRDTTGIGLRVRDHCAGVAAVVRVLARERRFRGGGRIFLAALLHDLGKLMLMDSGEVDYAEFGAEALESPDQVHVLERQRLGFDHADLAAGVMRGWGLDPKLARVVELHHQPGIAYAEGEELALGVAYLRFADAIEYEVNRSREPDPEALERLEAHDANAYLEFHAAGLGALWPQFVEAIDELLSLF